MIQVRQVFQAQWGKGGELAANMKEAVNAMAAGQGTSARVLTDLSGEFNTVVLETDHESLAAWEQFRSALFSSPEFQQGNARSDGLIVSGRQEYYTIEAAA